MRATVLSAMTIFLCSISGSLVHAGVIGVTFGNAPSAFTSGLNSTRGWEFSTTQAIDVTSLGLWDAGGDGFATSHQVGLWNAAGTLLASTTFAAGNTGVLGTDNFRYLDLLAPVSLGAGNYLIGAAFVVSDNDQIAQNVGPIAASGISYIGPRLSASGSGFSVPNNPSNVVGGAFGPNFMFNSTAAVPEPSSLLVMVGLALMGLTGRRRRAAIAV